MICKIGGWLLSNCCFVRCWFQDLFKTAHSIVVLCPFSLFSICFVSIHVVHPYSSIDTAIASKKSCFILSDRSDFHMIDNQSIVVYIFAQYMLTSLSIDKILLPRYVNLSTNFRGLLLKVEMAPSCLKQMNCFICVHIASCCLHKAMQ